MFYLLMFYIAKNTPKDLNFPIFSELELLSAGHATAICNWTCYNLQLN